MSDHTPPRAASPPPPLCRSALAWKVPGKPPHPHARPQPNYIACSGRSVFQVVCPLRLMPHQETRTLGWKSCCRHCLATFLGASAPRGRRHMRLPAAVPAQIAICEIADPHPLHHGKGVHPATRLPAVDCPLPPPPGYGRPSGPKQLSCGPAPRPSSQADDLQLLIIRAQPARNTMHTQRRFHVTAGLEVV